jgi:hypothetical protein
MVLNLGIGYRGGKSWLLVLAALLTQNLDVTKAEFGE